VKLGQASPSRCEPQRPLFATNMKEQGAKMMSALGSIQTLPGGT
jgi:hypothetical protein